MELKDITIGSISKIDNKELLSLNHRLHQLYGSVDNIKEIKHREEARILIIDKFEIITAEMKKRGMDIDTTTELYKIVFKKEPIPEGVVETLIDNIKGDIFVVDGYVDLIGSTVTGEEPNDIDILIRDPIRKESLEVLLSHLLPEEYRNYLHFVYDPTGPHKDYRPLFDLILKPSEHDIIDLTKDSLKPLIKFKPLKTYGGYGKEAFFSAEDAWKFWASGYTEQGVVIEEKYDGFRTIAEFDGNKTLIYFEDAKEDKSSLMPTIVADLKLIGKPVILDGELILIKDGKKIPRKDMMILLSENPKLEGYNFQLEVFDVLYYEEDIHIKPWYERKEILKKIFANHDFKEMKMVESHIVHNESDFMKYTEEVRKLPDSEGAFYKVYDSPYELGGKTPLWAKFKNIKEIHGIVLEVHEVK